MDESTEAIEAGAKSAAAAAAKASVSSTSPLAVPVQPLPVYIIAPDQRLEYADPDPAGGSVQGKTYLAGQTFSHPDEHLIAQLRKLGVLKLPEELASAEDLAASAREKDALLAAQAAEIEQLKAALAVTGKSGTSVISGKR